MKSELSFLTEFLQYTAAGAPSFPKLPIAAIYTKWKVKISIIKEASLNFNPDVLSRFSVEGVGTM